jgi:hypothetical protein
MNESIPHKEITQMFNFNLKEIEEDHITFTCGCFIYVHKDGTWENNSVPCNENCEYAPFAGEYASLAGESASLAGEYASLACEYAPLAVLNNKRENTPYKNIESYTGMAYRNLNWNLTHNIYDEETTNFSNELIAELKTLPNYTKPTTRIMTKGEFEYWFKDQKRVTITKFLSTSKREDWILNCMPEGNLLHCVIHGATGKDIESYSLCKSEEEVLFAPNTTFDVHYEENVLHLTEILPDEMTWDNAL